ncbi:MAG TPA: hypothetical protein DCL60_06170, partial [Armatimonadetes bacterium]|nr:hypothetical protein [Armatimonadota bacterium]
KEETASHETNWESRGEITPVAEDGYWVARFDWNTLQTKAHNGSYKTRVLWKANVTTFYTDDSGSATVSNLVVSSSTEYLLYSGTGTISITYSLQDSVPNNATNVTVDIYNSSQTRIRQSAFSEVTGSGKTYTWDGKNSGGVQQPKGVYLYKITASHTQDGCTDSDYDKSGWTISSVSAEETSYNATTGVSTMQASCTINPSGSSQSTATSAKLQILSPDLANAGIQEINNPAGSVCTFSDVNVTLNRKGNYTFLVTAKDKDGGMDKAHRVRPILPRASIVSSDISVTAPLEGAKLTFNDANPGALTITCTAQAAPASAERTSAITWTCKTLTGTTASFNNNARGGNVVLTLTGLPYSNSDFGEFWIKANVNGVETERKIKLFYPADATNSPGDGNNIVPNWYVYYLQTPAACGQSIYYVAPHTAGGFCTFNFGTNSWEVFITGNGHHLLSRSTWSYPCYIDRFAWTSRHEFKHKSLAISWWGQNPIVYFEDNDNDGVPDEQEPSIGRGYNPLMQATYPDEVGYSSEAYIKDCEDICMRTLGPVHVLDVLWSNGSADSYDWANPGKQF